MATGKALPAGKKDTYRVSVLATVPPGYSDDGARVLRNDVGTRLLQRRPDDQRRGRLRRRRLCADPAPGAADHSDTPTTPVTPTTPPPLPNTGVDVGGISLVALALFGAGALLLVLTGRRRRGNH